MARPRIPDQPPKVCQACGSRMAFRDVQQSVSRFRRRKYCSTACANNVAKPDFWRRTEKDPETGCWNWTGNISHKGYGTLERSGRHWRAHRLAYTLAKGEIPDGLMVLHSCDNRRCCNPAHLRVGTNRDNVMDAIERGRWTQVRKIEIPDEELFNGSIATVAARLNVGTTTVWRRRKEVREDGASV